MGRVSGSFGLMAPIMWCVIMPDLSLGSSCGFFAGEDGLDRVARGYRTEG